MPKKSMPAHQVCANERSKEVKKLREISEYDLIGCQFVFSA
jgi:hypothetical protein